MNMDLTQEIKRNAYDLAYLKGLISNENTETSWAAIFPANPMRVYKKAPRPYSRYLVNRLGQVKGPLGKVLKPYVNNAGYSVLPVTKDDGKSTTVPVQCIVATAWVNQPDTDKKLVVDHINDNKIDNRASNLRWVTYHDNLVKHHRMTTMSGEHSYIHGRAVIKISESGRKDYYKSLSAAARDNQMSVTSVQGSANDTLHLNKPYHFIFAK